MNKRFYKHTVIMHKRCNKMKILDSYVHKLCILNQMHTRLLLDSLYRKSLQLGYVCLLDASYYIITYARIITLSHMYIATKLVLILFYLDKYVCMIQNFESDMNFAYIFVVSNKNQLHIIRIFELSMYLSIVLNQMVPELQLVLL